ncbi:hypothetical protein HY620_00795 [Candidatus Uhrbacteria bacterium]|nr:hypothetical protein [Candidatus Uhrbacteria bacterium]
MEDTTQTTHEGQCAVGSAEEASCCGSGSCGNCDDGMCGIDETAVENTVQSKEA